MNDRANLIALPGKRTRVAVDVNAHLRDRRPPPHICVAIIDRAHCAVCGERINPNERTTP